MMYKKFKLIEIFDIVSPKCDDRINFISYNKKIENTKPFIGRSALNNGVTCFVEDRIGFLNKGNVLTIALDGSTGSTFYQPKDFYSGQNIWLLIPKTFNLTESNGLYFATLISQTVIDYSYNLSLTKDRLSEIVISLPADENGNFDIKSIDNYSKKLNNEAIKNININLPNFKNLEDVNILKIFDSPERIKNRLPLYKAEKYLLQYKDDINKVAFFSASYKKNFYGIKGWMAEKNIDSKQHIYNGKYVLINNNGSIGYTRFFSGKFIGTSDVTILKVKKEYETLFDFDNIVIYIVATIQKIISEKELNYNIKLKIDDIKKIHFPFAKNCNYFNTDCKIN